MTTKHRIKLFLIFFFSLTYITGWSFGLFLMYPWMTWMLPRLTEYWYTNPQHLLFFSVHFILLIVGAYFLIMAVSYFIVSLGKIVSIIQFSRKSKA